MCCNVQDNDLDLAAKEFDRDWGLVCARLNDKFSTHLTNSQCQKRWTQYVSPEIMDRKAGPWSADEVSLVLVFLFMKTIILRCIFGPMHLRFR